MFTQTELFFLKKLLNKLKYSKLDEYELNQFANSPISNQILKKLITDESIERTDEFHRLHPNVKRHCFKFDNEIGITIQNRLLKLDTSVFSTIANWTDIETEKFALDILGPIDFENIELIKLKKFIKSLGRI